MDGLHAINTETPKFGAITHSMPALRQLFIDVIDRYGITTEEKLWSVPAGDALPYVQAGYRVLQLIDVGNWYHSTADVPQAISKPGLERVTNAYRELLRKVDAMPSSALPPGRAAGSR